VSGFYGSNLLQINRTKLLVFVLFARFRTVGRLSIRSGFEKVLIREKIRIPTGKESLNRFQHKTRILGTFVLNLEASIIVTSDIFHLCQIEFPKHAILQLEAIMTDMLVRCFSLLISPGRPRGGSQSICNFTCDHFNAVRGFFKRRGSSENVIIITSTGCKCNWRGLVHKRNHEEA